jgi:hypothetical protein
VSDEARAFVKMHSPYRDSTFWVHYVMADMANAPHNYELYFGDAALMRDWPFSRSTISRARSQLIADGFLSVVDAASGPGRQIVYRFEFPGHENMCQDDTRTKPTRVTMTRERVSSVEPVLLPTEVELKEPSRVGTRGARADPFDAAWDIYPRKLARKLAAKAFAARLKEGIPVDDLMTATRNFVVSMRHREVDKILYPATFYGPNERWRDYLAAPIVEAPRRDPLRPNPNKPSLATRAAQLVEMEKTK